MRSMVTAILGAALFFGAQAQAAAGPAPVVGAPALTAVSFTPRADALEFVFRGQAALTGDQVSVYADDKDTEILNLKIAGVAVTRRWVTMPDVQIDRALMHPSNDAAVLRIRMKSKGSVNAAILDGVRVHDAEGAVVVRVPRSAAVAAQWALAEQPTAGPAQAAPVQAVGAQPVAPAQAVVPAQAAPAQAVPAQAAAAQAVGAQPVAPAPVTGVAEIAQPAQMPQVAAPGSVAPTSPASVGAVAPSRVGTPPAAETARVSTLADAPLTLPGELAFADEDPGAVVANAGVSESAGMGAAAATIFLLFGAGVFLWRKIRGHQGERGTGRLIRPLGTHVLGPKQGLLLLDVAGEMVLIGTSDKGVQMLTKIERSDRAPEAAAAKASPPASHGDLALLRNETTARAPKLNVAERATAAIAKVRAMAEARKAAQRLETADEDVTADPVERAFFERSEGDLAQAAADVEDDFEPRAESFFARLKLAAPPPSERGADISRPAVKPSTPRVSTPTPAASNRRPAAPVSGRGGSDEAALTNDILRKIRQLQGV